MKFRHATEPGNAPECSPGPFGNDRRSSAPGDRWSFVEEKMRAAIPFIVLFAVAGCDSRNLQEAQERTRLLVREPVLDRSQTQHQDILTGAANYPDRIRLYSGGTESTRPTLYGDPKLDQAANTLKDLARPWTFEKIRKAYESEEVFERRLSLLRVLAASRDPRAALILHELVSDDSLDVRLAALGGLWDHFIQIDGAWGGGTEQMFVDEAEWWRLYKTDLQRAASERDEQNDARERPSSSS
jgi:hypothetical protein